jgi:hypothetical protein
MTTPTTPKPPPAANYDDVRLRFEIMDKYLYDEQVNFFDKNAGSNQKHFEFYAQAKVLLGALAFAFSSLATLVGSLVISQPQCTQTGNGICDGAKAAAVILALLPLVLTTGSWLVSTMMELFQWERLAKLYGQTVVNLRRNAKLKPREYHSQEEYVQRVNVFSSGTLDVLTSDAAAWSEKNRQLDLQQRLKEFQAPKDEE